MAEPRISVVIPAFRAIGTIDAAIRSVLAQTVAPAEIIVVDDGSPDETAAHVTRTYPVVRLVRQENMGIGMARNAGVGAATGDWVAFLDADDAWLPGKLERQIPETRAADVAIVACRCVGQREPPFLPAPTFDDFWEGNQVPTSSCLVRRAALEEAGGFWSRRTCEDYHLWLRLAGQGWRVVNCAEELVLYTPAPNSLTRQTATFAETELACIRDVGDRFGLPAERVRRRLALCCLRHSLGARHLRQMRTARSLALRSLRYGVSAAQLRALALACVPEALLDAGRRAFELPRSASG